MKKIMFLVFLILIFTTTSCKRDYTIIFKDYDDSIILKTKASSLDEIYYPDEPTRDGYQFIRWDNDFLKLNKNITTKALYIKDETFEFTYKLYGFLPSDNKYYSINQEYKKSYFYRNANFFNKDLAMLSFSSAVSNNFEANINDYLDQLGFDNHEFYGYGLNTKDNVTYCLSHKRIDDFDLIFVSSVGSHYGSEWSNNFLVGDKENHLGFTNSSNKVYESLTNYMKKYDNSKLWMTGYSRGGGIINLLADKLLREGYNSTDMFVYTFEAPRGILKKNYKKYYNVYNIYNSEDLITCVLPENLNFYRCGIDIDIKNNNLHDLLLEFDPTIKASTFKATNYYNNQKEFIDCIIDVLTNKKYEHSMETREKYYKNLEPIVTYFLDILGHNISKSIASLNKVIDSSSYTKYLDETEFINLFISLFDELNVKYDKDELELRSRELFILINERLADILKYFINGYQNFGLVLDNHAGEGIYVLLKEYFK